MSTRTASTIGWKTAAALVVANMIGTGVFTSLGFQLVDLGNSWSIILLWMIGGAIALFGAFSYAEVGSAFPRSGGEYHYLTELYNPVIGYLAGWISLTVGFAAPVALACMALALYLQPYMGFSPEWFAIGCLVIVGAIHSVSLKSSSLFQNLITILKVALILVTIGLGLWWIPDTVYGNWSEDIFSEITGSAFAVALIFVTYSYTGWNAAAYVVDEIEDPQRSLPKALISGTILVTFLYVLLHIIFLLNAPIDAYAGKVEVGQIFAHHILGEQGAAVLSGFIAFFLLSSISAMVWVGPRVSMVMGEDWTLWHFLRRKNKRGIPVAAIWFQVAISVIMIVTGTFEAVLMYCGFILQLSSALCVYGSFRMRRQHRSMSFVSRFHPVFPMLYLVMSAWILIFLIKEQPTESALGMLNVGMGYLTFLISKKQSK